MVNRTDKRAVRGDDGFTVVEFVVAAAILLIVAVAVMGALAFGATSTAMNAQRQAANDLANERIEYARNLPYDDLGVEYGEPAGVIETPEEVGDFLVETDVRWARDPDTGRATYKQMTVTVSWDEPRASSVTFETNIYGSSSLVNTGDVLVKVLERDTSDPIEDASVSIDPSSGTTRELKTTDRGEAFFGFVPWGPVAIDAQMDGYLVDLSDVEGALVQVDIVNEYFVWAQPASTGIVKVIDSSGNPISGATVTIESDTGTTSSLETGADGLATFTDLFTGLYRVSVSAPGRVDGTGTFDIEYGGETVTTEISLADLGTLSVTVLHGGTGSPAPIEGATVHVRGPQPAFEDIAGSPATTASSGEVSFDLVASGTYTVTASMVGFDPVSEEVSGAVGEPTSIQIHLMPIQSGSLLVMTLDRRGRAEGNQRVQVDRQLLEGGGWVAVFDGLTGTNGVVALTDLEPGTYRARRGYLWWWLTWQYVDVAAGEQSVVALGR